MRKRHSRHHGFTLIELVTTVTVLAIVVTVAVPSFNGLVVRNDRAALANSYFGLFAYARYRATTTRQITTICPLGADNHCVDDWDKPVAVFPDDDRNGSPDDRPVWRRLPTPPETFHVFSRTGGRGYFRYDSTGMTYGLTGSLVLCPVDAPHASPSYIAVNRGGRLHDIEDGDHDGQIELPWGGSVGC